MQRPESVSRFNVANRLSKRSLLIAINCIAGLSIFFFGYDQYVPSPKAWTGVQI